MTAHEDRHIRFYDNNTGEAIHSMVAHLDAVTSLAVDPNGLYLLSGSKYSFYCPLTRMCCKKYGLGRCDIFVIPILSLSSLCIIELTFLKNV